ncbi:MAG TPA: HEAT repeat domain-containing protein [Kofleriaceae bacterium]|nr:HEAT repeat domain-containing protein [Kofleriaceae bacterium]
MRRYVLALLMFAACGPSAAAKRAQALYDQGDYQGAAKSADADLAAHPSDDALHRVALRARLAGGDARGAVDGYASWRAGRDDDRVALRLLAETTFQQALRSPSNAIKVQAIESIEELEIEDLADDVIQRLGDDDDQVQAAAAVAVLRAHPQAPEILASMLTSDDPVARAIAVRGMANKVGEHAADDLRNATRDPDPRVRRAAISGLAPLDDGATTDVLAQLAAKDADDGVRAAALHALARGSRGDQRAVANAALGDKSLAVRIAAVDVIVATKDAAAIHALLANPDPLVAIQAAHAAPPADAAATIDRALGDAAPETRAAALNLSVAALGKGPAAERAMRFTADASMTVRLSAARVLASTDHKADAINVLATALGTAPGAAPSDSMTRGGTAEPDDRIQAAADLARLGDSRGTSALADFARTGDTVPRRRAAVTAHLTARTITPGLVAALADAAPEVRVDAARALWSLVRSTDLAEEHAE